MSTDGSGQAVYCTCGHPLADRFDGTDVTIGDQTFQFRRSTDYLVCDECGAFHRVTDLVDAPTETTGRPGAGT